jgi:DNA-binding HxlR family transcriptional regulator
VIVARSGTRKPATAPGLDAVARQVRHLTRRLDALDDRRAAPAPPVARAGQEDLGLADTLAQRRGEPYERGNQRGAIAYGGGVELDGREYLWQIERPVPGLLALDPDGYTAVLAALAHPHRWRLIVALIEAPRAAAELQKVIGSASPGPLYHHLRELLALGIVAQRDRHYTVPARHVVPLLTAIALALDLGARPGATEPTPTPTPTPAPRSRRRR